MPLICVHEIYTQIGLTSHFKGQYNEFRRAPLLFVTQHTCSCAHAGWQPLHILGYAGSGLALFLACGKPCLKLL